MGLFLYIVGMKFIKGNWRYILLWVCIAAITQVFVENFECLFYECVELYFTDSYWFLTLVVPTLVLLIITWKKK